jgi:DNA-binding transcriptional LysR family regulator
MTITNITLNQLRILTAVVDEGSFSIAATKLGMTQSGASQAIGHLEAAIGSKLLVRSKEGIVPSAIGQLVLRDAREAVLALERIEQNCTAAAGLLKGELRIGSVTSAATRLLPPVLAQYRRRYPEIRLSLLEGTDQEVLHWVEIGIADIGLTSEASRDTESEIIAEDAFFLLVHPRHLLSKRRKAKLTELSEESFLMSGSGCEPAIRRLFESSGMTPKVVLTIRNGATLQEMVAQGLGVTMMPGLSLAADDRRFCCIATDPVGKRRVLSIVSRRKPTTPAVEKFSELLIGLRRKRTPSTDPAAA